MTLQRCTVRDLFALTSRRMTDEGYLVAPAKVSRTGIQVYSARELGLDKTKGMDGNARVRLLRPREEVFAPEAMASFDRQPVTDDHPPNGVTAANWNENAVGDAHDPTCAGETMDMELVVRDPDAIKAVKDDGKAEMSCGYAFDLDMTPGTTADGQAYDGIQRNIRGNHVAIVNYARGGSALRIADRDPTRSNQGDTMALVKIVLDGITLELEQTQASLVEKIDRDAKAAVKTAQDARSAAEAKATASEAALAAEKETKTKLIADHATALAESKAKEVTQAQIEALAEERSKVIADAKTLVDGLKPDGKAVGAIRSEVLTAIIGGDSALKPIVLAVLGKDKGGKDIAPDKATGEDVRKAFDAIVANGRATSIEDGRGSVNDPVVARALAGDADESRAAAASVKPISGRALLMYRGQNAGKDPNKATA